jgi:hypothetical protein
MLLPTSHPGVPASHIRLLEMLTGRFGVFKALTHSTSMDPQVAEAG